jgi:wobble nucleotide-excising tRNase
MIKRITIKGPASYKNEAVLETDKNINLIYGLNGSGKSTFSEYLRNYGADIYIGCSIEPAIEETAEVLVYNEKYVEDIFYNSDTQKGIFSLSKENADARKFIDKANRKLNIYREQIEQLDKTIHEVTTNFQCLQGNCFDRLWDIKKKYAGGDRVLEYCLDGFKSKKENLASHIIYLNCPQSKPDYTIESLKQDVQNLNDYKDAKINRLSPILLNVQNIECNQIFSDVITGNRESRVSELIDKWKISDWVKRGMNIETDGVCPFCQRPYTEDIVSELKQYFNEDYEKAIKLIRDCLNSYNEAIMQLSIPDHDDIPNQLQDYKQPLKEKYAKLKSLLSKNLNNINLKLNNPSNIVKLIDTSAIVAEINKIINEENRLIDSFNDKIEKRTEELQAIKQKFWLRHRYDYAQIITDYLNQKASVDAALAKYHEDKRRISSEMSELQYNIKVKQNEIINIEIAVEHINAMLTDMGITDFKIVQCDAAEGDLYRIVRENATEPIFKTLSEGERTIISLLYFIESCQGSVDRDKVNKSKIIVIDDPVSSLSNIYVFNIGRLLRSVFYPNYQRTENQDNELKYQINPKFDQVFILTHSLYFFYEMTEMDIDKRHASQALFRIAKNQSGSVISAMHYEQVQNDYHSYWLAINDKDTHPALIANCMRNIIEYFFNFVEKRDLNNVFNNEKFKALKYQAFLRYINRESHSLGQNIYDFKEFDYDIFMEAFSLVFELAGYKDHFKKMRKLKGK